MIESMDVEEEMMESMDVAEELKVFAEDESTVTSRKISPRLRRLSDEYTLHNHTLKCDK